MWMIAQMMIANQDDRVIIIVVLVVVLVEYRHMEIWMIVANISYFSTIYLFPEMIYFSKQSFPQDDLCILTPKLKLRPRCLIHGGVCLARARLCVILRLAG